MYATCLPSRIPFSCMHAGGWLRFVAKNTNARNSCFGSSHAPGKGNQPSPFPEGVQHCIVCCALSHQSKSNAWGGFIPVLAQGQV